MKHADLMGSVEGKARIFVVSAFAALQQEHVLPTPEFHPYVEVGRDYYGDSVHGPAFEALEAVLDAAVRGRFHHRRVGGAEQPEISDMDRVMSCRHEEPRDTIGERLVDEELQPAVRSGSSRSSTAAAA